MARRPAVLRLAVACLLGVACGSSPSPSGGSGSRGVDAGTPGGPARFAVAVATTGAGRVTSTPAGIDCGTSCSAPFDAGTHLSLIAAPSAGWRFVAWGGACSGTAACDLTVASDVTVSATFSQNPSPPSNACANIEPPADVAMRQYVVSQRDACLPATGDRGGTLAFPTVFAQASAHGATVDFVSTSGTFLRQSDLTAPPNLLQQPDGVAAVSGPSPFSGPPNVISFSSWDHGGNPLAHGSRFGDLHRVASAANPEGGVLVAGDYSTTFSGPTQHVAEMFVGPPAAVFNVMWGPQPLASAGTVFGAGVDLLGKALVVTDGAPKFGSGAISAQWFVDGKPVTGEFLLVSGFTPGASTWFEASPLVDGGLLVRRIDSDHGLHSQVLVVVAAGSTSPNPAPDWMASRRDVQFHLARGNRAYATLPYGAPNVACSQRVEVLAADGTSCGSLDYAIAAGNCDTGDLTMAADGTVIQPLPLSMETTLDVHGSHTCTWRWWAGAAR